MPPKNDQPEPWLRGTYADLPPVQRAAFHALELAREDIHRWCGDLTDTEVNARSYGIAPVAFHLRHIGRSIDRLLTYAEGLQLSELQMAELRSEAEPGATREELLSELDVRLDRALQRVRAFDSAQLQEPRSVGRRALPTTVASLLIHIAEHTQRHVGQAITTVKIVRPSQAE